MNILEKEGINPSTLGLLQFIKLNNGSEGYILNILRQYLFEFQTESGQKPHEILEKAGYIKYIKTGRKEPVYRLRLSDKGENILKEMMMKPTHELAEFMLEYTTSEYKRIGADKTYIQGGGKILNYISEFLYMKESYSETMIKAVIKAYVNQFEYDKKYLNKMANLFFKSKNAFATKFTPEDCPLWQFIENNQDLIKHVYKTLK